MTTYFNETSWPTTTINSENIRWESVKTEEEEYLDKLQSKLKRVMSHAAQGSLSNLNSGPGSFAKNDHRSSAHRDSDVSSGTNERDLLVDAELNVPGDNDNHIIVPPVDDEGLHLLYDQKRSNDVVEAEDRAENPQVAVIEQDFPRDTDEPSAEDGEQGYQQDPTDTLHTRPRVVRFHSRVRIGSGIRDISTSSSPCESASSSVIVPLRDNRSSDSRPGLTGHPTASLTEMLTTDATNAWLNGLSAVRRAKQQQAGKVSANGTPRRKQSSDSSTSTERTALLAHVYSYSEPIENDFDDELDRIQTAARKTEEEVMFGKWPWKLFNRYWWWWRLEPVVCCCERFDDESDSEG